MQWFKPRGGSFHAAPCRLVSDSPSAVNADEGDDDDDDDECR